jgi:hypothetical protein
MRVVDASALSFIGGVTGSGPVGRGFTPPPAVGEGDVVAVAVAVGLVTTLVGVVAVVVGESDAPPLAGGAPTGVSTQETVPPRERIAIKPAWERRMARGYHPRATLPRRYGL